VVDAPPGVPLVYRWSLPSNAQGLLAADLDLGPAGEAPSVTGMCAEFGNACVLTADKQSFYDEPMIFFVAPTCDALPKNTAKAFRGTTSRIKQRVTAGKRHVGREADGPTDPARAGGAATTRPAAARRAPPIDSGSTRRLFVSR